VHAFVPIDDHECWVFGLTWHPSRPLTAPERRLYAEGRGGVYAELRDDGSFVTRRNVDNGFELDRVAQRLGASWSGVRGNQEQDDVVTSSIGPEHSRADERLIPTDAAVVAVRRRLLAGAAPAGAPGLDEPAAAGLPGVDGVGFGAHSLAVELPADADWRREVARAARGERPAGALEPAGSGASA
jgi:phthalate 4,5-dioxygenase oxygenase subunit